MAVTRITASPSWLVTSASERMIPRSGLLLERRASRTVARTRSVSPGRTGFGQRTSSTPAAPRPDSGLMKCSTSSRIIMLVVCQPLAISPPNGPSAAAKGST
jgi:hypothetical protein